MLSERHLTARDKAIRTSSSVLTALNVTKMYVGICIITVSRSIANAGLFTSLVGFTYIFAISVYSVYLIIKARNRFKHDKIIDICDLSLKLYGPDSMVPPLVSIGLIVQNSVFLFAFMIYIGEQIDQLMCTTWKRAECGNNHLYTVIVLVCISPILLTKRLRNIGFFSGAMLFATLIAYILITYVSLRIYNEPLSETQETYDITIAE